jgi:chromate reductase
MAVSASPPNSQSPSRLMKTRLRHIFVYLNMHPLNKPQVAITNAKTKLDASWEFTNPAITDSVGQLLVALDVWTRRLRKG